MASPDCDDGWLKYAHELDAALAAADFTKGARIVLREVFAQIFGPAKAAAARLSPAEIARRSGQRREHVSRAVKELVDSGVLVHNDDDSYRFVKDYESWIGWDRKGPTGQPRLSVQEVSYCRHAPAVALAYKHGYPINERTPMGTDEPDERAHRGTERVPIGVQNRTHRGTPTVPIGVRAEAPPYRNGRAEFETEETLRLKTADGGGGLGSERIQDEEKGFPVRCPEHRLTIEHARAAFGDKFALVVADRGRDIDERTGGKWECFRAAIDAAKRSKKSIGDLYGWCIKVAIEYAINGIPPEPVSSSPAALTMDERAEKARKAIDFSPRERP